MAEGMIEVNDDNFETEVLKSDIPVLVDFWAPWCGPCRMIAPALEQIAESHSETLKVAKLNVDESMKTAARYGVMSIPTLILFKGGEAKETLVGALPKDKIEEKISKHL